MRSEETLTHFQCDSCQGWFTVGDAPVEKSDWYCCWCGKPVSIQEART